MSADSISKERIVFFAVIFLVILFGIALRGWVLINLGDFWYDEVVVAEIIKYPLAEGWNYLKFENNPPLYFWLLRLWSLIFGSSETQLRLLSFVFGLLSLPAIYALGSRFFNPRVGAISAALVSISSFLIFHQTEARMYSLLFFLLVMSVYFFWRAVNEAGSFFMYGGYFLFTLASLYTSLTALPLVVIEAIFLFFHPVKSRKWLYFIMAGCFILFLPWLVQFLSRIFEVGQFGFLQESWYFRSSGIHIPFSVFIPAQFLVKITFLSLFTFALTILAAFVIFFAIFENKAGSISLRDGHRSSILFLVLLFGVPLVISAISINISALRLFLPSALAFYILLACGLEHIRERCKRILFRPHAFFAWVILIALIIANVMAIVGSREPLQNVANFAKSNGVKDVLISPSGMVGLLIKHYLEPGGINVLTPMVDPLSGKSISGEYLAYNIKYNWGWMMATVRDFRDAKMLDETIQSATLPRKFLYIYQAKPKELYVRQLLRKEGFGCKKGTWLVSYEQRYRVLLLEKGLPDSGDLKCSDY